MDQIEEENEPSTFCINANRKVNFNEDNNSTGSSDDDEKRIFLFDMLLNMFHSWEIALIRHSSVGSIQQYKKIWNKNFSHTQSLIDHLYNYSYTYKNNKSLKTEVKLSHEISSFDDKKESYFSKIETKPYIHEFDRLYLERKEIIKQNRQDKKQKRKMASREKNGCLEKYCNTKNENNNTNNNTGKDFPNIMQKNNFRPKYYEKNLKQERVLNPIKTSREVKKEKTKTRLIEETESIKSSKKSENIASHNKTTFFKVTETRFKDREFLNAQIEQTIQTAYRYLLRAAIYAFSCHIEDSEIPSVNKAKSKTQKIEQIKTTIEKFNILKSGVDLKLGYRQKDLEGLVTAPRNIIKFLDNLSDCITQVYPEKKPVQLKFQTSRVMKGPKVLQNFDLIRKSKAKFNSVLKFCSFLLISATRGNISQINSYIVGLSKLIIKVTELFYMFLYLHNSDRFESLLESKLLRLYPRFILLITVQLFCTILSDIDFCWKASGMNHREKHYLLIFVNEFSIKYLKRNKIVLRNKANINNAKSVFVMPSADGKKHKTFNGMLLKDPSMGEKKIFQMIKSICSHKSNFDWSQITSIIKGVLEKLTGMDRDEFEENDIVLEDLLILEKEQSSKLMRTSILKDENLQIIAKIGSDLMEMGSEIIDIGPIRKETDSNEKTIDSQLSRETLLKSKIFKLTKINLENERKDIKDNLNKNGRHSSQLTHLSSFLIDSGSNKSSELKNTIKSSKEEVGETDKSRLSELLGNFETLLTNKDYNQTKNLNNKEIIKFLDSIDKNDLRKLKTLLAKKNIHSKELEKKLSEKKLQDAKRNNKIPRPKHLKNEFNENQSAKDEADVKEFFQTYWQPKLSEASKELNLDLDTLLNKKLSEKKFQESMKKVMEHPLVKPMFKKIDLDFDPSIVANALGALSLRDNTLLGRRYTYRDLTNPDLSTIYKFVNVDEMPTKLKERESQTLNIQLLSESDHHDEHLDSRKLSQLQSILAYEIQNKHGENLQNNDEIEEVFLNKVDFNNKDADRKKEIMMVSHGYLSYQNFDKDKPLKNPTPIKN